jgi:hypothetical protein
VVVDSKPDEGFLWTIMKFEIWELDSQLFNKKNMLPISELYMYPRKYNIVQPSTFIVGLPFQLNTFQNDTDGYVV